MTNCHRGFTLIELMVVIAIIGLLAAIAIPSYNDYVGRSQVSEAAALLSGLKPGVVGYHGQFGGVPNVAQLTDFGAGSITSGRYTSTITLENSNEYTATMRLASVGSTVSGKTLKLIYSTNNGSFTCSVGSLPAKFAPSACK